MKIFIAICLASWLAVAPNLAGAAASLDRTTVFRRGEGPYHTYRIPAIVATSDGGLLAFCEGRRNAAGDTGDIDVLCRRSADGGRTWTDVQVVWDEGFDSAGNPCPVVDRTTGAIWLLMTRNHGDDTEAEISAGTGEGTRTVWISSSDDGGDTWSRPKEITASAKDVSWTWYATGPGAGIQIEHGPHAGRLVVPCDHNRKKRRYSHVIYSDDHGRTWRRGAPTPQDNVNECEVVELKGGRLMLNMRNYDRRTPARQIAFSDNGGGAWYGQRHDPTLIEPICQASIRRVRWPAAEQPGVILFSNPADAKNRRNLTVRMSKDDGATWPYAATLYAGSSAYSCLVALPDDQAGCVYEIDDYSSIVFQRFSLDWLEQHRRN